MTSSQDRAVVKKKLKEMKVSLEKARKAQEKMEKQREKLRRKEQEQMQRKSKKTEKMTAVSEGAGEQWRTPPPRQLSPLPALVSSRGRKELMAGVMCSRPSGEPRVAYLHFLQ